MAVPQLLLESLEHLSKHGFVEFKWWLGKGVDFKRIPQSLLDDADQMDTVGKMMDYYGEEMAVNIAVNILKKTGRDDIAKRLTFRYAAGGDTAAPSRSTSVAAPPAAPVAPPAAPVAPPAAPVAPPAAPVAPRAAPVAPPAAPVAPPAAPVAPPAAPASMMAHDQSNIIAQNIAGSTIGTLNINFYK